MSQQRTISIFSGTVQGVGFRYTARQIAQNFLISGYVKNLPDGTVELVTEGEKKEINAFLAALNQTLGQYIRKSTRSDGPATNSYFNFAIKH